MRRPTGTTLGVAHGQAMARAPRQIRWWRAPHKNRGTVGAQSMGGGGRLDFGADRRWGGSRMVSRATRQCGELDWVISGRSDSPERALSDGGGSAEELIDARWEERRVATVVRLVGTRKSWWSSRIEWQHRTRTPGGWRWEALWRWQNPTERKKWAATWGTRLSHLGEEWLNGEGSRWWRWLGGSPGIAAIYGKEEVSGGPEHSAAWTASHRRGQGDSGVETVGNARTGPVGTTGPLKASDFTEFGWCVALTCLVPSDKGARRQPRHNWQVGRRTRFSTSWIIAEIKLSLGK
jgi:hypothetical protein